MINHNVNVLRNTCFVIVLRILPIACVVICMDELFWTDQTQRLWNRYLDSVVNTLDAVLFAEEITWTYWLEWSRDDGNSRVIKSLGILSYLNKKNLTCGVINNALYKIYHINCTEEKNKLYIQNIQWEIATIQQQAMLCSYMRENSAHLIKIFSTGLRDSMQQAVSDRDLCSDGLFSGKLSVSEQSLLAATLSSAWCWPFLGKVNSPILSRNSCNIYKDFRKWHF